MSKSALLDNDRFKIKELPLEIIDGDRGTNYPKQNEFYDKECTLFLSAKNVTKEGFNFSEKQFITKEKDELLRKGKLQRNDIILTTRGTVGNVALYGDTVPFENIRINSGMVIIRCDDSRLIPEYFYYVLKSNTFINQVENFRSGSAQPQLPIRDMRNIKLPLPSIEEQKEVIRHIGSIDKKINLNQRMNETLEQIGQTLFKHYFIDNLEVKTWPEGGINKFARSMRKSEKPPFNSDTAYVGLEHFTRRSLAIYSWGQASDVNSNKSAFNNGDLLFGKLRPYFHKVAIAPVSGVCSTDVLVVRANDATYQGFVYHFLNQTSLISYVTRASEGTRMPRTSWKNIEGFRFRIPPTIKVKEFSGTVRPLHELIIHNVMEIRQLNELRNSLLPHLISGKIKV